MHGLPRGDGPIAFKADNGVAIASNVSELSLPPRRSRRARREHREAKAMQVDFGEKRVFVGGHEVVVHLMAAVLGYSAPSVSTPSAAMSKARSCEPAHWGFADDGA